MSRLLHYLENTAKDAYNLAQIAQLASLEYIGRSNPLIANCIEKELKEQRTNLKLIASENYSSLAVQLAMGNWLTDKYAEGYVDHRFYAGCENVDAIEREGNRLLRKIFSCEHAYMQPHSGADANIVALWAILVERVQSRELERLSKKTLDELTKDEYESIRMLMCKQKLMGMSLGAGGHLTHGYIHNISSKMLQAVSYGVDEKTGLIDYADLQRKVKEEKPDILLAGYSSYPRRLNFAKMREIADSVGAVLMVDMAHFAGLVAGKVLLGEENPVPYADVLSSTTHKTLRGPRGGMILSKEKYGEVLDKGCPLVLGGPLPHVMAAKTIAFQEADSEEFCKYSSKVVDNARQLAESLQTKGARLLTGGTDNHLLVLDLAAFSITGRQAESALREAGLTVNRNAIPNDPFGPWYTSGIRLGTAALTSLGMGLKEMEEVAGLITHLLSSVKAATVERTGLASKAKYENDDKVMKEVQVRVKELLASFPLYPELSF